MFSQLVGFYQLRLGRLDMMEVSILPTYGVKIGDTFTKTRVLTTIPITTPLNKVNKENNLTSY